MFSLLLAIIYLAFISLGLPDSLLGSAWPVMRLEFGASLSFAGVISMIISGGTILSSLISNRISHRFGTGRVTVVSVAMTAAALLGFSLSSSLPVLCLFAIPYGLGAGGVDAALNHYVALHYSGRHMSWLHCMWGIGASVSPYIMSFSISQGNWRNGYLTVSIIQFVLTLFLFLSLPLWKSGSAEESEKAPESAQLGITDTLRIRGVPYVLIAFFSYCALEGTCGLWASSFFVECRGIDKETAASLAALFYLGITFGRFLNGFLADRFGDSTLIRIGCCIMLGGMVLVALPVQVCAFIGLPIIGLGCAPVYPCIIHATPTSFGEENSQAIVGIQMASAYIGSTFVPPFFGWLARSINLSIYPFFLIAFALLLLCMIERLRVVLKKQKA